MKEKEFPRFWFESNLYFDWVNDINDLQIVFDNYDGHMTPDKILDMAVNVDDKLDNFGLRMEHQGDVSLREFLFNNGIILK